MKTYRQLLIPNNGLAGTEPPLAAKLNEAAAEGWTFETLIPVPGTYLCALLSCPNIATDPTSTTPSPKRRK
jgi:hypothetical protein